MPHYKRVRKGLCAYAYGHLPFETTTPSETARAVYLYLNHKSTQDRTLSCTFRHTCNQTPVPLVLTN